MKNLSYFGSVMLLGGGVSLMLSGGLGFLLEKGLVGSLSFMSYMSHISGSFVQMDSMSCLFAGVVMYISGLVSLYGEWYVGNKGRFFILVFLFVFSMVLLIVSPSFFVFMWGWDLLGLVSYCLVIYYQDVGTYNAGMITALSNRVGDSALLFVMVIYSSVGSWDFSIFPGDKILLTLIVLVGITKSAQLPFCAWLPAAMAAPTPVSALVHSSTLVTAGVYLLIRYLGDEGSLVLTFLGLVTSCIAGFNAMIGFDFKKIIALSTLSQLGLMMTSIGLGYSTLAYYHLLTHAVVKALLFLSAGGFIHNSFGLQDIRLVFGSGRNYPWLSGCLLYSSLALSGLPFLACFYSKEPILQESLGWGGLIVVLLFMAGGITSAYSLRVIYYLYGQGYGKNSYVNTEELNSQIYIPTGGLLLMSVVLGGSVGWLLVELVMSVSGSFTFMPWIMIMVALAVSGSSSNYKWGGSMSERFMGSLLFLPLLSGMYSSKKFLQVGSSMIKYEESGWSELAGGQGGYQGASGMMSEMHKYQISKYMVGVVLWLVMVMFV
uniref:NADH-ubiquinone oxidoreductase chain 5 n=1 Tax=Cypridina dentata TaxID=1483471 RepID=A0A4D6TK83_9CRUS|nr:NADH dehydrogenase subunit 5 [Cypridina dentata]QCG82520.1 NADH dehydrogenase subunit 5 [Cypridina dentata]